MTGSVRGAAELLRSFLEAGDLLLNEPMAEHCSFRTGGPADLFIRLRTEEELRETLLCLKRESVPVFLLGRGTNLLVGDGGFRGAVVTMAERGDAPLSQVSVDEEHERMTVGGGAALRTAASAARDSSLTGLEFAAGIPGSLGGAVMMNAGAYGGEMRHVVRKVRMMTFDGQIVTKSGGEMEFGYRTSCLKKEPAIVLSAELELQRGDREKISEKIADLGRQRAEKQPLEYPSAGSTFKRPEGLFAGKLIMDAGLRGLRVGDAQVSEKHCGFIINRGGATSAHIRALIEEVQRIVLEQSGVLLEKEVIFLGEF